MKFFGVILFVAGALSAATLQDVHKVYVFPMRNGLDQYLVGRLAANHVFEVVTDPKTADAVFTDRMGPAFETSFDETVLGEKPKAVEEAHHASFGAKGNIFLITKGKQVIWSDFDPPRDPSPRQLEKAARRSVTKLMKDMGMNGSTQKATAQ